MSLRPVDIPPDRVPLSTFEMLPPEPLPQPVTAPPVAGGPMPVAARPATQAPAVTPVRPARPLRLPIRARLAVWYSLLLAFVLVLFSTLVYITLTQNLATTVDQSLEDQATIIGQQSIITFDGTTLQIRPPHISDVSDIFVQITDTEGNVVLKTAQLPLGPTALAVARGGDARHETISLNGQTIRVYYATLVLRGRPIGLIEVARSLEATNATAADLARQLALGSGLALLAALGLGWLISGQALRPLGRIGRAAADIGQARDFSRRVPYAGPNDEVGRLAAGFNTMLDRLQGAYADEQDAARRLEAALVAQHRFVADASHELRTPLTAIRGNAELLQRIPDMTAGDRSDSIAQIAAESQRMSRLVGDLLTLARADAGGDLHRAPVAVGPLVESAVAAARHLGQATLILRDPLPAVTVHGDADRLKQLLLILLDNALKYTPPAGQVTVRVAQHGTEIALSVEDSGVGIAAADLPHIFERFYRADPARTAGGTGLGLAIAGWIVQAHGGRIHVASTPGAGSVFTVLLPLADDQFLPDSEVTLQPL
ncbi:MAG: ATP-binding protein [Chloroflexota bacterium]|nr:ATP-binding protein [Chloroflexota bacterium]